MELNAGIRDAFGHPIEEGDVCLLSKQDQPLWRVARIEKVLDPRVPPGSLKITFQATTQFIAQGGASNAEFYRVWSQQEQRELSATTLPARDKE